ncbi:MAG: hypothetical protein NZ954_06895 [Thermofilaceae archaeon]|nr:hypothetical protein [Thermofilaceae archaeon]
MSPALDLRLRKAPESKVQVLAPKVFFAYMVSCILKEVREPKIVNKELFKQGVWSSSFATINFVHMEKVRKAWLSKVEPSEMSSFIGFFSRSIWYAFTGHSPKVETKVLEGKSLIWVEVEGQPTSEAFYEIVLPDKVNALFYLAGVYEGAAQTVLGWIKMDAFWFSFWRPLDDIGVCGFFARRELPVNDVVKTVQARRPDFFDVVTWAESSLVLNEFLGSNVPTTSSSRNTRVDGALVAQGDKPSRW